MLPEEYARYDALGLASLLRRGEVTSAELVEASHVLADRANPAINAIVEMYGQAGPGQADGVFGGVPFLVKDIGCTAAGRRGVVDPAWYYEQSSCGNLESFTSLFNCTGQPAVSLPLQQSQDGLPIGIQLAAGLGREDRLLGLAAELEAIHPWAGRHPPTWPAGGTETAA